MSPEVLARNIEHTLAIDIWSLGLIYFKMLTGRVAFPGGSEELIFRSIKERKIKWPEGSSESYISPDEKDLIEQMLQSDPEKRLGGSIESMPMLKLHKVFKSIDWDEISSPNYVGAKKLYQELEEMEKSHRTEK